MASSRLRWLFSDNTLMGICVVGALACGSMATLYKPELVQEAKGDSIAVVSQKISKVKRKPSDALVWNDLAAADQLFDGDQIFTDRDATANVRFADGSEIDVSENSLITIEQRGDGTTIDMAKGFISGQLGSGAQAFTIKMGKTNVALAKGTRVQIQIDPKNKNINQVSLVSGSASITGQRGKGVQLAADQTLSVDGATGASNITDIQLKQLSPNDQAMLFLRKGEATAFAWQRSGDESSKVTLVMASDPGFSNIVLNRSVLGERLEVSSLAAGTYFWKLRTAAGEESLTRRLRVVELTPPEPRAPVENKVFLVDSEESKAQSALIWASREEFDRFEVQLARDSDFSSLVLDETVLAPPLVTPDLPPGEYFWRLRGLSRAGKPTPFSRTMRFVVTVPNLPEPPRIKEPSDKTQLAASDVAQVHFSFDPTNDAAGYELQVARDRQFTSIIADESLTGSFFSWSPEKAGIYYWRVRSRDRFGRETKYSTVRSLIVALGAAKPLLPDAGQLFVLEGEGLSVPFLWSQVPGAEHYLLEVAQDRDFEVRVFRRRIDEPKFAWNLKKSGRYFWRVSTLHGIGNEKSTAFSPVRQFDVRTIERLRPPKLQEKYYFRLQPPSNGSAWQRVKEWWNAMGTAYAANIDGDKVIVAWEPVAGASSYEIELAADPAFENIMETTATQTARFFWRQARPGRFYLRARSLDTEGKPGSLSPTSTVIVTYQPPALYAPPANTTHTVGDEQTSISMRWQSVPGTLQYRLQMTKNSSFASLDHDISMNRSTYEFKSVESGRWYWRVGALYAKGTPWEWSRINSFVVQDAPKTIVQEPSVLATPYWKSPEAGAELVFFDAKKPTAFEWSVQDGDAMYHLKIRDGEEERIYKTSQNLVRIDGLSAGAYTAMVRAIDDAGRPGLWSAPLEFTRKQKSIEAPQPVFPQDGLELAARSKLMMRWRKELGFDGYRLVLSRDKEFKDVVTQKTLRDNKALITVPDPGLYYWYVEGKHKQRRLASRSPVQMFKLSEPGRPTKDRAEIMAALAPAMISNSMQGTLTASNSEVANDLAVVSTSSYVVEGQYWFSQRFGGEVAYHYKATELFDQEEDREGLDQEPLTFDPQDYSARLLYRHPLSVRPGSIEFLGRAGYLNKSLFSYFSPSRSTLALLETQTHNLSLGLGAKFPAAKKHYLEAGFDINAPLSASGVELASGYYARIDAGYYILMTRSLRGGVAYRYSLGTYDFKDHEHGIEGTLIETTHSLLFALRYGF